MLKLSTILCDILYASGALTAHLSLVTLARPAMPPALQITDSGFCYASSCLWSQLPAFYQPHHSRS